MISFIRQRLPAADHSCRASAEPLLLGCQISGCKSISLCYLRMQVDAAGSLLQTLVDVLFQEPFSQVTKHRDLIKRSVFLHGLVGGA